MCCTFGDQNDIYWFKIHKLPFVQVVGFDGKWTVAAGPLAGLNVHEARKKVIELLRDVGALVGQKTITHSVNTHERCKQELEYQILTQWFVKILEFKNDFLKLADQIKWYPEFMKARYSDWVEHLNWDWVISRQRYSGIPFPVWHCQKCSEVLLADATLLPIDPQEVAYPGGACPKCGGTDLKPDTDVMDTWNTSSLTPQVNLRWPAQSPDNLCLPMSLRLQAHDIIRTWAFYTIVKAYYHHKTIPWTNIMMSGHVLAGKDKISKSQGNSKLTPETLLATYPADVIRYWAASGRLGTDTAFSENQLKIGQRLVTKLWNALRFCSQHLQAYQPASTQPALDPLNQWVLHHLGITVKTYVDHFDAFEYYAALEKVETFFWHVFCDNYLELIKDQLFTPEHYAVDQLAATRYTLYQVGYGVVQLFAPFLPHLTETLYQQLFKVHEKKISLHVTMLDEKRYDFNFAEQAQVVDLLVSIVGTVRKIKSEKQLSLKVELDQLVIYAAGTQLVAGLKSLEQILIGVTNAKALVFDTAVIEQSSLEQTAAGLVAHIKV
jgi:valyl-tRNA synthetase